MSKFTFYYGCMNSGKSLDLIRTAYNYTERGMGAICFKSKTDTRVFIDTEDEYTRIETRVGLSERAFWLDDNIENLVPGMLSDIEYREEMLGMSAKVILVDEAQFLTKEQVLELKKFSYKYDIPFIFYGLKVDFQGNLFEGTKALLSLSEKCVELITMCSCGKPARQNARVVNKKIIREGEQVAIEGDTKYVALCNKCYLTKNEV